MERDRLFEDLIHIEIVMLGFVSIQAVKARLRIG